MNDTYPAAEPFLITREEAPSYWLVDSVWSVLASADTTGGALTVLDQMMPGRSGPPPHVHERLHEYFYLLNGEIRFQLGTEVRTATGGAMLSVPPNTVHAFAVVSETARVLNLYTPGGFTEQISYLGTPAGYVRPKAVSRMATRPRCIPPSMSRTPRPLSTTTLGSQTLVRSARAVVRTTTITSAVPVDA